MARKFHERRSLATALRTYLDTKGWNSTVIKEGYQFDTAINPPLVAVHFMPSAFSELEIGRGDGKRNFVRRVQIDCYMESENRVEAITDDIADFIDETTIVVIDTETSTELGYMFIPDFNNVTTETIPPVMKEPKVARWRGVVKCTYEIFYD